MGMFEQTLVPNDLQQVCNTIDEYYAEEAPVVEATPAKKSK
jgi:hypothetical protein